MCVHVFVTTNKILCYKRTIFWRLFKQSEIYTWCHCLRHLNSWCCLRRCNTYFWRNYFIVRRALDYKSSMNFNWLSLFCFCSSNASSEYLILVAHACFLPRIPTTTNSYLSITYLSHAWCFSTTVWYWRYLLYIILFSICVGKSESLTYLQT